MHARMAATALRTLLLAGSAMIAVAATTGSGRAAPATITSSGQYLTPAAAPGAVFTALNPGLADNPSYVAGQAISTAVSQASLAANAADGRGAKPVSFRSRMPGSQRPRPR